jgi:hypothetical protein
MNISTNPFPRCICIAAKFASAGSATKWLDHPDWYACTGAPAALVTAELRLMTKAPPSTLMLIFPAAG